MVYVIFGLVMLGVVVFSLLVTGNLAATFNERAKGDLKNALEPLATLLEGTSDVEEATVSGRYHGQITTGKIVAGPGGMGRLFQTTFVEPAGGKEWTAVVRRPKTEAEDWARSFEGDPQELSDTIFPLLNGLLPYPGWFEMKYDPEAGSLRLTRAMQSRRDVPTPERFTAYLAVLDQAAQANRHAQAEISG
jgi:hypothetical protein